MTLNEPNKASPTPKAEEVAVHSQPKRGNPNSGQICGVYTFSGEDAFEPILVHLESNGIEHGGGLDALTRQLDEDQGARVIVIYENPVTSLVARMKQDEPLPDCLEDWAKTTENLLALYRRNRRRLTLMDGNSALGNGALASHWLHELLGIPSIDEPNHGWSENPTKGGALHLLVDGALRRHDRTGALLAELEASSQPLGAAWELDLEAAIAELAIAAQEPAGTHSDELVEENGLLLLQLQQVQEELECNYLTNRELEQKLQEAAGRPDPGEMNKLRNHSNELQAQLAESRSQQEVAREQIRDLNEKLSYKEQSIQKLRNSLSWKVTAPIRKVLGLFMGRTDF